MNTATATAPSQPAKVLVTKESTPEVGAAETRAVATAAEVKAMVIDCPDMFEVAGNLLIEIRGRYAAIEKQRVHVKEPFLEGCRRIDAMFKVPLDQLTAAGNDLKARMLVFQEAEEERVRKANAEALRIQQEEAARLQKIQDDALAAEQAAQAEADQLRLDAEATAAELVDAGDVDQAAAVLDTAEAAAAEVLVPAQAQAEEAQTALELVSYHAPALVQSGARAAGISTRKTWKVKSIDKLALVLGVAAAHAAQDQDKVDQLLAYVLTDESALNKVAGALKGSARVPGVTFHEVSSLAATGRRGGV